MDRKQNTWKGLSVITVMIFHKCFFVLAVASQTSTDTTSAADDNSLEEKPAKKSKKGKKVQWPADDANLATFHFFEMDEDERGLPIQLVAVN